MEKNLVEMELRCRPVQLEYQEKGESAHQFSARSISLQADSEEREEIELNCNLIDAKVKNSEWKDPVDIYDLNNMSFTMKGTTAAGLIPPEKTGGKLLGKVSKDQGTGTDFSRKMLAPRDWFYSNLFREMLKDFC